MSSPRVLIYLLRRDLRFADNPVFYEIAKASQLAQPPYTHLLPVYIFAAQQVEVSGFLRPDADPSPFPEARSQVGRFWRCGPHRARFLAESVWDLKTTLTAVGSGLDVRVGLAGQVIRELVAALQQQNTDVAAVWMTGEEGVEEKQEERDVKQAARDLGTEFQLWTDEKYYVDDRDIPFRNAHDLPDVFTTYRKQMEPLRDAPRPVLATPSTLPPLPPRIPLQGGPFAIPSGLDDIITCLLRPLDPALGLTHPPKMPSGALSAHPFHGGETTGHERIRHLIRDGHMNTYKDTRNGMMGLDYSTKLSAWLALGCVTARQIHGYLMDFEEARSDVGRGVPGYGAGENKGTAAVRFELLWRDYFRLATRKFGPRLFRIEGFKNESTHAWKYPHKDRDAQQQVNRFLEGTTGTGFIDASMRELFLTGYTSNRLRQNVASFLAKHLDIDWRIGAEWYESLLCDYDLSNNWGNWQYNAGVGNDPREARVFNPVKQAHDYDPTGAYVKHWIPELRPVDDVQAVFQPWKLTADQREELGLRGKSWVEKPLKRIEFHLGRNGGGGGGGGGSGGGGGGGGTRGRGGARGGRPGAGRGGYGGSGARGRGDKARGLVRREREGKEVVNENGDGPGSGQG